MLVKLTSWMRVGFTGGSKLLQWARSSWTMRRKASSSMCKPDAPTTSRQASTVSVDWAQSPVSSGSSSAIIVCNLERWLFRSSFTNSVSSTPNARCICALTAFDGAFDWAFAGSLSATVAPTLDTEPMRCEAATLASRPIRSWASWSSRFSLSFSSCSSLIAAEITCNEPSKSTKGMQGRRRRRVRGGGLSVRLPRRRRP
mmetsp:Transcript_106003/g.304807  ORF Transcript_106003/g.304807 Transcript_106003/m.304807 type:complete len:200 (+) Transcript_106003:498-1097(+)